MCIVVACLSLSLCTGAGIKCNPKDRAFEIWEILISYDFGGHLT